MRHNLRLVSLGFLTAIQVTSPALAKDESSGLPPEAVRATLAATVLCQSLAEAARNRQEFEAASAGVATASSRGPQPKGGLVAWTVTPGSCKITYDGPDSIQILSGLTGEPDEHRRSGSCSRIVAKNFAFTCWRDKNVYEITIEQPSIINGLRLLINVDLKSSSPEASGIDCRRITGKSCEPAQR